MTGGSGREQAGADGSGLPPGPLPPAPACSHLLPSAAFLLLTACANIQAPPGGPPDTTPPRLASVFPESLAVIPGFKGNVEFRFNEVISEGSTPSQGRGTSDLERLVILSPTNRFPDVSWHRRRITVHPAEGWKPNRVYRVELLPGISDVRQNRSKVESVVTFTTGGDLPSDTLRGRIFDWKAGNPAAAALVEALLEPDSLPYRTLADSSGQFSFGPLPRGEYLVYGVLDQNRNLRRDPREAFDTVRIKPESVKVAKPELYAFAHDTLPPRIQQITPMDSVTASITFAQSLDPYQKLDSTAASVRKLPDSTAVPVIALVLHDTSLAGPGGPRLERSPDTTTAPRRPDTLAIPRRADSAAARLPDSLFGRMRGVSGFTRPTMNRPPLSDRVTLRVGQPWHPGDHFVISIAGVRTVSGRLGDVQAPLIVPQERTRRPGLRSDSAEVDSMKVRRGPRDSLERRQGPDSLPRPDSLQKADSLHQRRR
ncbi:MAG TPA: Ig-like domain-containing protein [Gemmatimonadales bacterium]|nr:Ig-like domain-containing protein [Gemmatimonadales bacterium]